MVPYSTITTLRGEIYEEVHFKQQCNYCFLYCRNNLSIDLNTDVVFNIYSTFNIYFNANLLKFSDHC